MDYEGLAPTYMAQQHERVKKALQRIREVGSPALGRVIPESEDLLIGEARRLPLAVMFLDISGFSARPSYFPQEQALLVRVLNLFFTEMTRIAEDYDGTVEKNTGDGLMAYFADNAGTPPTRATQRAVACALTMFSTGNRLINPILQDNAVAPISFRIGIDYGEVTVARLGAPRRFNAVVAVGTPANIASKMLAKAGPGDLLLGEQARNQLPLDWQRTYTVPLTADSGFFYRATNAPYLLYQYTGRWRLP